MEQAINTYVDRRPEGLHSDLEGVSLTGANGRRIILRNDPDGLYFGGVLVTDKNTIRNLAHVLLTYAR